MGVPDRAATTEYAPEVPLAIAVMVAKPDASVVAEAALRVAEAPLDGELNRTTDPAATGVPPLVRTSTLSGMANAVPSAAPWLFPVEMLTVGGGVKAAVTLRSPVMVMVQVEVLPVQAPPQPVKDAPETGEAVRTTEVPLTNAPVAVVQDVPQEIDAGTVITEPPLGLVLVSDRVRRTPMESVSTALLLVVSGSMAPPPSVAVAVLVTVPFPVPAMMVPLMR